MKISNLFLSLIAVMFTIGATSCDAVNDAVDNLGKVDIIIGDYKVDLETPVTSIQEEASRVSIKIEGNNTTRSMDTFKFEGEEEVNLNDLLDKYKDQAKMVEDLSISGFTITTIAANIDSEAKLTNIKVSIEGVGEYSIESYNVGDGFVSDDKLESLIEQGLDNLLKGQTLKIKLTGEISIRPEDQNIKHILTFKRVVASGNLTKL